MYVYCDKVGDVHVDAHLVWACKFFAILAAYKAKGICMYKLSTKSQRVSEDALQELWVFNID